MYKHTKECLDAFQAGKVYTAGHDFIAYSSGLNETTWYLHGNAIACRRNNRFLSVASCGWKSRTTMERINAILTMLPFKARVHVVKGTWYLTHCGTVGGDEKTEYFDNGFTFDLADRYGDVTAF